MELTKDLFDEKGYACLHKTPQNLRDQYVNLMTKTKTTVSAITKAMQEQKNPGGTKGQEHCQRATRENQRKQNQTEQKTTDIIPQSNANLFKNHLRNNRFHLPKSKIRR